MKSRVVSLLILVVFLSVSVFLLNSCSSSNHTASYPVIHKLKNEKFANNIKHINKIRNGDISSNRVRRAEPKLTIIDPEGPQQSENRAVPLLPRSACDVSSGSSESAPDIASSDNDIGFVNYNPTSENRWSKALNYPQHHVKKSRKGFTGALSPNGKGDDETPIYGLISFMLGIVGLCFLINPFSAFVFLFIGVFALGMGIMGLKKKYKALAIIGMVLGILCIIIGFLALGFI